LIQINGWQKKTIGQLTKTIKSFYRKLAVKNGLFICSGR
jgi:hypothetical protein